MTPSPPTPDCFLQLEHVSKHFGGVLAVDRIDWDVRRGEVHCLVGENGCGKSTLIKIVAGTHAPDQGSRIVLDGREFAALTPAVAKDLGVQVIFQDLSLFPNLTVAENIAMSEHLEHGAIAVNYARLRRGAQAVLDRLGFHLPLDAAVADLSIAERQVVAICRGLAHQARILFMDEPTASLTRSEVNALLAIVARLKAEGIAIVFVSHRLDEVIEIADRVTIMRDGVKVGTFAARDLDVGRIGELMTGRIFDHALKARPAARGEPVLVAEQLTRRGQYHDISLTLHAGEVVGLTGLLGAGRTELALTLFGMTRADSGRVRVGSAEIRDNRSAIAAGIAYVSEDRLNLGLNLRQSIADNVVLASLDRLAGRLGLIAPAARTRLAQTWVERLRIRIPGLGHPVTTLSGGNQQRVVLAKWLATRPKVLILDSPTVGVDIGNKRGIYDLIAELAADGVAILLISDEIAEVYYNCDRIVQMRGGRMVASFVPGETAEADVKAAVHA
jgi:simple sugar transport system ATP-binding protein